MHHTAQRSTQASERGARRRRRDAAPVARSHRSQPVAIERSSGRPITYRQEKRRQLGVFLRLPALRSGARSISAVGDFASLCGRALPNHFPSN